MKQAVWYFICCLIAGANLCYAQTNAALPAREFEQQIEKKNVQLLDVRTQSEYESGHIKQSMLADWTKPDQFTDRIQYLDKSSAVYVYCLSGGRSGAAAKWMRANGFVAVYELQGGINAWKSASLPLEAAVAVKQMSLSDYHAQIGQNALVLVDFGAVWCPPCQKMKPIVEQLKKDLGASLQLVNVDGSTQTELMQQLKIDGIPAFIAYRNGQEVWRKQGVANLQELKDALHVN
jgi:rhodanese-related sulfurtransferase